MKLIERDIISVIKDVMGSDNVVRFTPGPRSLRGIPDLMVFYRMRTYWIEIKVDDRSLTENQKAFLKKTETAMVIHIDNRKRLVSIYENGETPTMLFSLIKLNILWPRLMQKTKGGWLLQHRAIREVLC